MCQAADAKGKNTDVVHSDEHEPEEDRERVPEVFAPPAPAPSRGKGLSFKVLQWLTDTAEDEENDAEVESMSTFVRYEALLSCIMIFTHYYSKMS